MVDKTATIFQQGLNAIALNSDKWQNKDEVTTDDKNRDKKSAARAPRVAAKPRRYKLTKESASKEGSGLGGKVYGVREGTSEYGPSKGTPQERKDSTRPVDSTRHLRISTVESAEFYCLQYFLC